MFADEEFIASTREFVCIRVETYKHPDMDNMMTEMFRGKLPNSAFCLFDPTGQKQICTPSRTPYSLVDGEVGDDGKRVSLAMLSIAANYKAVNETKPALLQDFKTTEEALNITSADQRLLVLLATDHLGVREKLKRVMSHSDVLGKFHLDIVDKNENHWKSLLSDPVPGPGIIIVQADQFGLEGNIVRTIAENCPEHHMKRLLLEVNHTYSEAEERKDRDEHIATGTAQGVFYDLEKPTNARTEILRGGGSRR